MRQSAARTRPKKRTWLRSATAECTAMANCTSRDFLRDSGNFCTSLGSKKTSGEITVNISIVICLETLATSGQQSYINVCPGGGMMERAAPTREVSGFESQSLHHAQLLELGAQHANDSGDIPQPECQFNPSPMKLGRLHFYNFR